MLLIEQTKELRKSLFTEEDFLLNVAGYTIDSEELLLHLNNISLEDGIHRMKTESEDSLDLVWSVSSNETIEDLEKHTNLLFGTDLT